MPIYAQILSALFALGAATLWFAAALVETPRSYSVQVTTWHPHKSERQDGSETAGGGHGTGEDERRWVSRSPRSSIASLIYKARARSRPHPGGHALATGNPLRASPAHDAGNRLCLGYRYYPTLCCHSRSRRHKAARHDRPLAKRSFAPAGRYFRAYDSSNFRIIPIEVRRTHKDDLVYRQRSVIMDTNTLLVILVVIFVLGGFGFYGRGRWY